MNKNVKKFVDWLICGPDGKVHVVQFPNFPIIAWFVCMVIANILHAGTARSGFSILSLIFLAIWSYEEITQGESRLRQLFGIAIAIVIIVDVFHFL